MRVDGIIFFCACCTCMCMRVEQGRTKEGELGNGGAVTLLTTASVRTEDGSLRLEPGVMTTSSSVLPQALQSLSRENIHFLN